MWIPRRRLEYASQCYKKLNFKVYIAYYKANYARYLTAEMLALPKSRLEVYQAFNDGQISVQVLYLNNPLDKYQLITLLR